MNEERRLILQMVAEGKITPEEADQLLQAIDEAEQATEKAAADTARGAGGGSQSSPGLEDAIDGIVKETLRGLDQSMRQIHASMRPHWDDVTSRRLRTGLEEKMRRIAERAARRAEDAAQHASERAARHADRAAERAEQVAEQAAERVSRHAEHAAERAARQAERAAERARREEERASERDERAAFAFRFKDHTGACAGERFFKVGIHFDKVSVQRQQQLSLPVTAGDRILLENRTGDVTVQFHVGDQLEIDAQMTVWGGDEEDARERMDATKIELTRSGSDVVVGVVRPSLAGIGIMQLRGPHIDFNIRVPHGCHLQLSSKAGDLTVQGGDAIGSWKLYSKTGDIAIVLPSKTAFAYDLISKLGTVSMDTDEATEDHGNRLSGQIGADGGRIEAVSKTGSIRIHRR